MATLSTTIYQQQNLDVNTKADMGDFIGRVRQLYFELSPTVNTGAADVINVCKIPPGARVIDIFVAAATGAGTFGWAASSDGVEAASAAGLSATVTTSTRMLGTVAGFCKKFNSQVDAQITLSGAITAGASVLKGYIEYVID